MDIKVMTFNLRVNVQSDGVNAWPNRVDKVSEVIRTHNPVIFGTQEGTLEMINDLNKELPDYHCFGQGRLGGKEGEFNAIYYKESAVEPLDTETFWLSENPSEPGSISWESSLPRICTVAHFQIGTGIEFLFYNTHLDHLSQDARENGIKLIIEHVENNLESMKLPIILMGDFNSEPTNKVISILDNKSPLISSYQNMTNVGTTFHNFTGREEGSPIDYIYFSDNIIIKEVGIDRNKYNDGYPTDHYPVWADVKLT
jgi:endonuclease/exonuclease/phosphatase family metal-dependent hydrolase